MNRRFVAPFSPGTLLAVLFTLSTLVTFAGCASSEPPTPEAPVVQVCEEPRSPMCTMDYRPVCAQLREASIEKTYSNGCTACSDAEVVSYVDGACP
jgi:hypothetical protein